MMHTFLQALPFALGGAVSPTMLAVVVVLLASPKQGRLKGFLFFLGALVVSIAFCFLVHFVLKGIAQRHPSRGQLRIDGVIDVVVGVLLVLWAIVRVVHQPKSKDDADRQAKHVQLGLAGSFVAGIALMATNFSTLPLYALAIREVGHSKLPEVEQVLELVLITAIVLIPAWLPVVIAVVAPRQSERVLASLRDFLNRHGRMIITALLALIGFYLLVKGGPRVWA